MKEYRLTAKDTLTLTDRIIEMDEGSVKVRISKAALAYNDVMQYRGLIGDFGIVPLRNAVGLVSDPQASGEFSRGERVYIEPYLYCGDCYNCKTDHKQFCDKVLRMGATTDGFLTEFKKVPAENLVTLPDSVTDEQALFIEPIATAINLIDRLDVGKGDHIAVFGSNIIANLLCQLALYYQAVPILVDNNDFNVETAKKCGVYYTITTDAEAERQITEITGGRMAEKLVYFASSRFSTKNIFPCCSYGAKVALSGIAQNNVVTNYHQALEKQLELCFVPNGFGSTYSAINMLVNKAVQTAPFLKSTEAFANAPKAFAAFAEEDLNTQLMYKVAINIE